MSTVVLSSKVELLLFKEDKLSKSSKENSKSWKNLAVKKFIVISERRIP